MYKRFIAGFTGVLVGIAIVWYLASCAAMLPVIRGIVDIATLLCENSMSEQPKAVLGGKTVKQFCRIEKNLKPFIDETLKAKQNACQTLQE